MIESTSRGSAQHARPGTGPYFHPAVSSQFALAEKHRGAQIAGGRAPGLSDWPAMARGCRDDWPVSRSPATPGNPPGHAPYASLPTPGRTPRPVTGGSCVSPGAAFYVCDTGQLTGCHSARGRRELSAGTTHARLLDHRPGWAPARRPGVNARPPTSPVEGVFDLSRTLGDSLLPAAHPIVRQSQTPLW